MPIDMNGAATAVDSLESALSRHRGAAANWDAASEYVHASAGGAPASSGLELRTVVPLPPAFVAQYSSFEFKSFMGLFPEVGRAWLTADTRLFLWSYGEDTVLRGAPAADDFYAYDGFDQIIVAVALVRPRANVFIDDVRHLVAVATPVEVTLLGVTFSGDGAAGELSLIPTSMSVATDGVVMLSITATPDGRIFMAGSDGNLHEFVYYAPPSGWASTLFGARAAKRPRKLVHKSSSIVNLVLPTAVRDYFAPVDELVDMALDAASNALYTLSASGTLSVHDISDEASARLVRAVDVSAHAKSLLSYSLPAAEREYIAIFPVPPHLSTSVQLVVVSSFGERIYFSTAPPWAASPAVQPRAAAPASSSPPPPRAQPSPSPPPSLFARPGVKRSAPEPPMFPTGEAPARPFSRPATLKCVGGRGTPVRDAGVPAQRLCVHMALWSSGSVVLCDLRQGDHDRLVSIFPDPAAGRGGASAQGDADGTGGGGGGGGHGGLVAGGGYAAAAAPRALLPPAGQARPAECVHELSLGLSAGGYGPGHGGGGGGGDSGGATPGRGGRAGAGQSLYVRTFAVAPVDERHHLHRGPSAPPTVAPLLEPSSMFWVLTSSAMRLYARTPPRRRLAGILAASTAGVDDRNLDAFFAHHGAVEASAVCLDLATSDPSVATAAARALYTHGARSLARPDKGVSVWHGHQSADGGVGGDAGGVAGLAGTPGRASLFGMRRQLNPTASGARPSPGFDLGRPTQRPVAPASFSGVHDGICVFLARALHPVWDEYVCTSRDPTAYQQMVVSPECLDSSREALCALVSFLDQYDPDSMLPFDEEDGAVAGGGAGAGRDWRDGARAGGGGASRGHHRGEGGGGGGVSAAGYEPTSTPGGRSIQDRLYGRSGLVRMRKSSEARRAEVGAIHNVKELTLRCSEALAFLSILSDHQLHRIVPSLQPALREELVNMKFCDLVARTPGATVAAALIEVLFRSFAAGGGDLSPLCKLLQSRCPSYFDDDDMTLQTGIQRIRAASTLLGLAAQDGESLSGGLPGGEAGDAVPEDVPQADRDSAVQLAEEAVQLLKPLSSRIYNIESACSQVARVGAVPAAIELALSIGDAADRDADHARASEAYEAVLEMVGSLVEQCAAVEAGAVPRDVERKRDAAIRVALSSSSDRFHDMLYSSLMRSKAGERELLARLSPRVDAYLHSQERKDLMWKYYAQHGRHADAAAVLVAMAEDDGDSATLVDRIGYLSRALHNAKAAVTSGDVKAAALETDVNDYMDVARVQLRLRDELARCRSPSAEMEPAQRELDAKVLDLTVLYNEYALPFGLHESTLDVLRCGSYRDDDQVRDLWTRIVDSEIDDSQLPTLLEQRIVALGRDFYPSDIVFPTRFIVDLLERRTFERRGEEAWASAAAGWVSSALVKVGVPLGEIVDAYRAMIESNPHQAAAGTGSTMSWSDEESQLHAIHGALWALSLWADRAVSRAGRYDVERRMLVAESEKALRTVALCKSRLRGMSNAAAQALVQRFDGIESALSSY
jgi:hypothetical protein